MDHDKTIVSKKPCMGGAKGLRIFVHPLRLKAPIESVGSTSWWHWRYCVALGWWLQVEDSSDKNWRCWLMAQIKVKLLADGSGKSCWDNPCLPRCWLALICFMAQTIVVVLLSRHHWKAKDLVGQCNWYLSFVGHMHFTKWCPQPPVWLCQQCPHCCYGAYGRRPFWQRWRIGK